MSRLIGIATPNLDDPACEAQIALLQQAGCQPIHSPRKRDAAAFRLKVLSGAGEGDLFCAVALHNLATGQSDILSLLNHIEGAGYHFYTLDGQIDTREPMSRKTIAAFNEMTAHFNSLRSKKLLAEARDAGIVLGRKPHFTEKDWPRIRSKLLVKKLADVAREERVARQTIYQFISKMENKSE